MTLTWVIGRRGLLGAALVRVLQTRGTAPFVPAHDFAWGRAEAVAAQMASAVRDFSAQAQSASGWQIYWAAGIGTFSSTADDLALETQALAALLTALQADARLAALPGAVALASSAGALYAGSTDDVISEASALAPTTAYAQAKLSQEQLVQAYAQTQSGKTALLARIATLYGAGQASGKKQGLLAHMARSIVRNRPIQIYVPYDTIRDYIDADDAAASMVGALRSLPGSPAVLTRIIASENPVTIAEIIAVFGRIARRAPRIVRSANRLSALYAPCVRFRSQFAADDTVPHRKRLPVGIAQLMAAERLAYLKSRPASGVAATLAPTTGHPRPAAASRAVPARTAP